ncbi:hypothetical protein [Halovenus salina]|uniref:Regulatory protein, FmdB family n=1 Tax=Halovenus salina TaxID=1510225 RepID=A0ABD5W0V5_9EURY|nr:hypothetical protein [Halovenus salina]
MPAFDTYTCNECGTAFKAMAGANAAESGYCSPVCERAGKER